MLECEALSNQGTKCARIPGHVGCHERYVDGDGRRWWGDSRTEAHDAPWMDAGREAIWAFQELQEATTIGQQSAAYIKLHNAMDDLSSYFPEFDYETGMDSIGGEPEE